MVDKKTEIKSVVASNKAKTASFGKHFLSGTKVNPQLPNDQAKCAIDLLNKKFTAEKIEAFILPYEAVNDVPVFCTTQKEVQDKAVRKTFYKIAVID